ncbi:MAG: beta-lactamase family protein [Prevotellaceae bacterium]|jgi:CubicO group peptidase (beta-lactamase class C family)|nr:beta-lactamase family protein [Prevotellaceae bacterium]
MNKLKLLKQLAILFVAFLFVACSNDDNYTPSDDFLLKNFSFTSTTPGISSEIPGVIVNRLDPSGTLSNAFVLITVPEGCDLTALKSSFSIHEKAKLYINDTEQVSGQSSVDYSSIVTLKVKSETGLEKKYDVLVKKGGDYVIDNKVYQLMGTYSIPGISISVAKGDNIIYSYGYGFADVSTKEKVTPNHLFRLASISKQFTTICIMKLYEEGKLDLDDKVFGTGGILDDEFPDITGTKADVTIKNFLNHTSGWISSPYDPQFDAPYKNYTLEEQITYMLSTNQANAVGATYSYYNLGFSILGKVIEKVSGKGYEEYLQEVMALAGVTDVHVGKDRAGKRSNECVYYSQNNYNGYGNNMPAIAAAGGLIASTEEMMTLIVQVDGKGSDILQPATVQEMYTSHNPNYAGYGLGWRLGHRLYPGAHYHSGNIAGTATIWCGDTDDGISAVILMNSRSYLSSPSGNFDDAYYVLLGDVVAHFSN